MNYNQLISLLQPLYDSRESQAIVRTVLEEQFGMTLTDIVCGKVNELSSESERTLGEIMRRLQAGEPVQYVLGRARFRGQEWTVRPGVLIPRPETEGLVDMVVAAVGDRRGLRVLDVGTGSGCIAISVALERPACEVSAWDIAPEALLTAKENAQRMEASVNVVRQDALTATAEGRQWDVIVSNPPYVTCRERADMARNVADHEPALALFVPDDDPLCFYRAISRYAAESLTAGGQLFFELNPLYAADTARLMRRDGFSEVAIVKDCYGKDRFARGTWDCKKQ